ncbi:MAG: ATP-binding cassette domain-containing protein [Myxococcota bacterium]|jgi:excinuclease ABC subunit A|nr:ATP-binding cassette domain-containing protein [Myxococcota bacterium]
MTKRQDQNIVVRQAREHNLAGFDIALPRESLAVVTGVSGSGKSSLAFDTIHQEGQRRFLETMPSYARSFSAGLSRPSATSFSGLGPAVAVGRRVVLKNPRSTVGTITEVYDLLRLFMARLGTSESGVVPTRALFSFNSEEGACGACKGLGLMDALDPELIVADPTKSLRDGALRVSTGNGYLMYSQVTLAVLDEVLREHGGDVDTPWQTLSEDVRHVVFYGSQRRKVPFGKHPLESRMKWTGITARPRQEGYYRGLVPIMEEILRGKRNDSILRYVQTRECPTCGGARLRPEALGVRWRGASIADLSGMNASSLRAFLAASAHTGRELAVAGPICEDIEARCDLLEELGLSSLAFDRAAPTLSMGEAQRLRLASLALGELRGLVMVLDEPTAGLHPHDTGKLLSVLRRLRDKGQTVIAVEHDAMVARSADWLVDLGPGPGSLGGQLLWSGPPSELLASCAEPASPTMTWLRGGSFMRKRRQGNGQVKVRALSRHNLHHADLEFLRQGLNLVTGVSGAGKTSLLCAVANRLRTGEKGAFSRIVTVDAEPIGRTPRSNPATYSGAFDEIRAVFAASPQAKARALSKGSFSFNTTGGRCEACQGAGAIEIGMRYLGSVDLVCETCGGKRFHEEVLEVRYRDASIADVLESSIAEAVELFADHPKLRRILGALVDMGLGYLHLGQPATTLSGGEAQRVKLATELAGAGKGNALLILDEPSNGLHGADMASMLRAWDRLLDAGHTLLVADNDLELARCADRVIDIGPGSGPDGGRIVFQGLPEELERCLGSITAQCLRDGRQPDPSGPRVRPENPPPMALNGVSTHNLRAIDIQIPARGLCVVTGPSGSGKSSLVFDTLLTEAEARFADIVAPWARRFLPRGGGARLESAADLQATVSVSHSAGRRNPRSTVGTMSEIGELLRLLFSRLGKRTCEGCGELAGLSACACGSVRPRLWAGAFSSNTEAGACPHCKGLGFVPKCDAAALITHPDRPLHAGAMQGSRFGSYLGEPHGQHMATLAAAAASFGLDVSLPWSTLGQREKTLCLEGALDRVFEVEWRYKRGKRQGAHRFHATWPGLLSLVEREHERTHAGASGESLEGLMGEVPCSECLGERLRPEPRSVSLAGQRLPEALKGSLEQLRDWFDAMEAEPAKLGLSAWELEASAPLRAELSHRLGLLLDAGLGYLSADRQASSLSGGELARLRLASALGGGLVGITYVLDEPTKGLHTRDVERLCGVLRGLADAGNAVVVVEHDAALVAKADLVVELGPSSGPMGGQITAFGPPSELLPQSHTARLLRAARRAPARTPRAPRPGVTVRGARQHNLRDLEVSFPAGVFIAVTGVSGSGKSTLVHEVLGRSIEARLRGAPCVGCQDLELHTPVDEVLSLRQGASTGGGQSTVATLCGVAEVLRKRFAATEQARALGLLAKHFSTASPGGRCEECEGRGSVTIPMDLLPDVTVGCEACGGQKFGDRVLECNLFGRDIAQLLETPIGEVASRFEKDAALTAPLRALCDLGLSYLRLGQEAKTLSAGELQRLRLGLLLRSTNQQKAAVLLDEPTRGLGLDDVDRLVAHLHELVEAGHLVVVVEHNLDLVAAADWIIDLGPEGGEGGGRVVVEGPPALVQACRASHTGLALAARGYLSM